MILDIIKILKDVNFIEYEVKVYLVLLEKFFFLGYVILLNSGVFRFKIYEVLGGLVDWGEIMVSYENFVLYILLFFNELINLKKCKVEFLLEVVEEVFENYFYVFLNRENIWNIIGYEFILNCIKEVIKEVIGCILLEIWLEDV